MRPNRCDATTAPAACQGPAAALPQYLSHGREAAKQARVGGSTPGSLSASGSGRPGPFTRRVLRRHRLPPQGRSDSRLFAALSTPAPRTLLLFRAESRIGVVPLSGARSTTCFAAAIETVPTGADPNEGTERLVTPTVGAHLGAG